VTFTEHHTNVYITLKNIKVKLKFMVHYNMLANKPPQGVNTARSKIFSSRKDV
jgi:hypothetical protein